MTDKIYCSKCGLEKIAVHSFGANTVLCRNLCDVDESEKRFYNGMTGYLVGSAIKIGEKDIITRMDRFESMLHQMRKIIDIQQTQMDLLYRRTTIKYIGLPPLKKKRNQSK